MMWLIAAISSALIFGTGGFLLKVGSHKNYPGASMLLGLYVAGTTIFMVILLAKGGITLNGLILIFSILIGLGSYYGNTFLVKAYELGPSSLTSPLMNISILLVVLLSAFVYDEKITTWQYAGIACMVVAVSLLGRNTHNTLIKSRMWLIFVGLSILFIFMREGGMKMAHETGLNNIVILFFGYLLASILAAKKLLATNLELSHHHQKGFLFGTLIGLFSAIGMGLLAYAIAHGPASVVIPIFSTRNFVAVLLLVIFFREKLSSLQWVAAGLLILGILLIS